MDFTGLLKSIEDLLYELVAWLVFYPITFWRCVRRPLRMFDCAHRELSAHSDERFADTLSPPLFLFLTIVLAHVIDVGVTPNRHTLGGVFDDARNLLLFRAVSFSLFPMILAVQTVRHRSLPLTRETLRPSFYGHCLLAAPFVLAIDLSLTVGNLVGGNAATVGGVIFLVGLIWYLTTLARWFAAERSVSIARALGLAGFYTALGATAWLLLILLAAFPLAIEIWDTTP